MGRHLAIVATLLLAVAHGALLATPAAAPGQRARTAPAARALQPRMSVSVKTLKPGDGKTFPKAGQMVKAHYTGKLMDGTVFDTSRKILGGFGGIGAFEFQIGAGEVIKGWDVGMAKMSLGETAELTVGPSFGYGQRGAGDDIPPNAVLIFEVELLGISGKPFF